MLLSEYNMGPVSNVSLYYRPSDDSGTVEFLRDGTFKCFPPGWLNVGVWTEYVQPLDKGPRG